MWDIGSARECGGAGGTVGFEGLLATSSVRLAPDSFPSRGSQCGTRRAEGASVFYDPSVSFADSSLCAREPMGCGNQGATAPVKDAGSCANAFSTVAIFSC